MVLSEIRRSDREAAARRLEAIGGFAVPALTDEVRNLHHTYSERLDIGPQAQADLLHVAFAVAYEVDYLLTWNCAHIANGEIIRRVMDINQGIGRFTPLMLTPDELLECPEEERQ